MFTSCTTVPKPCKTHTSGLSINTNSVSSAACWHTKCLSKVPWQNTCPRNEGRWSPTRSTVQSSVCRPSNRDRRSVDMTNADRVGYPSISYLELYVRYNTVIWNYMHEHDYRVAPSRGWPAGVVLPSRPRPILPSASSAAKASMSRRDDSEVWDLSSQPAYADADSVIRSYPPLISVNFYPLDVRTLCNLSFTQKTYLFRPYHYHDYCDRRTRFVMYCSSHLYTTLFLYSA
jgi:hypothetical protein